MMQSACWYFLFKFIDKNNSSILIQYFIEFLKKSKKKFMLFYKNIINFIFGFFPKIIKRENNIKKQKYQITSDKYYTKALHQIILVYR